MEVLNTCATLAIGDVHGCLRALDALLEDVDPQPDDLVVLLGDYIDRGPDSKGVLDRLLLLRARCRCVTLKGNHELMMLAGREGQGALTSGSNAVGSKRWPPTRLMRIWRLSRRLSLHSIGDSSNTTVCRILKPPRICSSTRMPHQTCHLKSSPIICCTGRIWRPRHGDRTNRVRR